MHESKDIAMRIFLWFIFIVIALFLVFWLYNIYLEYMRPGEAGIGGTAAMKCSGFIFEVYDASYDGSVLQFTIRNKMGDTLKKVTVQSDTDEADFDLGILGADREKSVIIENFTAGDAVAVFPEGCAKYNREIVNIR